jgi:hypothetical protein
VTTGEYPLLYVFCCFFALLADSVEGETRSREREFVDVVLGVTIQVPSRFVVKLSLLRSFSEQERKV